MLDLKDIAEPDIKRNVMAQAALRLKLGVPVGLIAIGFKLLTQTLSDAAATPGFTVIAGYILYVGAIWVVTRFKPSWLSWQVIAVTTAALDPFVLSAWLFVEGQHAVIVIGFLLFSILGFGFRLGRPIMHFCQSIAVACFLVVMTVSDYWSQHTNFAFSHLVLLLVVPVYAGTLIRDFQRAKTQAEEDSRAKSRLLANVSHELRTPLNAIIGFSEIMRSELFGAHSIRRYRDYSHHINASGTHLLSVINDILDAAKLEAGRQTLTESTIGVAELVDQAEHLLKFGAREGNVNVITFVPRDIPDIRVDVLRMRQVLINLLSNAVKFTPCGGRVSVTASTEDNGDVVIRVKDNGIGMRATDIEKVFQPFVQLDQPAPRGDTGTGLGLSLSKTLVEAHGGTLTLESELGIGTTVTIRLPKARTVAPAAQARDVLAQAA